MDSIFNIYINNVEVDYKSLSFSSPFNSMANSVSFSVSDTGEFGFDDLSLHADVVVKFKGMQIMIGHIDNITESSTTNSYDVTVSARCYTLRMIDSKMRIIQRPKGYDFATFFKEVTVFDLEVLSKKKITKLGAPVKSNIGQSFGDFWSSVAKQRGVFFKSTKNDQTKVNLVDVAYLKEELDAFSVAEAAISVTRSKNASGQFRRYTVYGSEETGKERMAGQVENEDVPFDNKFFVNTAKFPVSTRSQLLVMAKQERSLGLAKTSVVSLTLPVEKNSVYYESGRLCIYDGVFYFIEKVVYNVSIDRATVTIDLVDKDTYE